MTESESVALPFGDSPSTQRLYYTIRYSPDVYKRQAPLPAENVLQQVMVMAAVFSAEPVVGSHQRLRLSLFHRGLEAGEIELSERPLVHGSLHIEPACLLIVSGKMLHTCLLYTSSFCTAHASLIVLVLHVLHVLDNH